MTARTIVITGASDGIGASAARTLSKQGEQVVVVGRSAEKTAQVAKEIGADHYVADFAELAQVRRLAEQLKEKYPRIDVLANNAGGIMGRRELTVDGHEKTFQINHLAPFLLTHLLAERLKQSAPARVVTVSSDAQRMGRIDFDDLQGERSWSGQRAYNQSKLANVLFTYELARRLRGHGVTANTLHPGIVRTGLGAEDPGRIQRMITPFMRLLKSPEEGAVTSIHLASATELDGVTGQFFAGRRPRRSSRRSYDEAAAARLWDVSCRLTGIETGISPGQDDT